MKFFLPVLLLTIALLTTGHIHSQVCKPVFKKTYGGNGHDETRSIIATTDKGSMVAGRTTSGTAGDYDAVLLKLAEDGSIQWTRRYGGNNDDVFSKVKQTTDGGYICIGTTKSFGNSQGEVWIVKTDATGTMAWARHYGKPGIYSKGKEIVQLSGGGFIFIANEADSTAQSNAIICRIDAAGLISWTRVFDHGNEDGFNSIAIAGNDVYVAGFATVDRKDGILMRMAVADGGTTYLKKYVRHINQDDELIDVEPTQDGISFGSRSYFVTPSNSHISNLVFIKMKSDGSIYFRRRADVSFNQFRPEHLQIKQTHDSGFIVIACDSTLSGSPVAARMGPTGMNEWGKNLRNFENARVFGLDVIDSSGYLIGGHTNSFQTGFKNKITVHRTNINGNVSNCTAGFYGIFVDTTNFSITDFTWNNISTTILPINNSINPASADPGFSTTGICSAQFCVGGPPIVDTCNSTFLMRYRSPQNIRTWDIQPTPDGGYMLVGFFGTMIQTEPFLAKLTKSGDVLWSRTMNSYMHTGLFKKALLTADGQVLLLGVDNYTVNHGSADSSILMKVNSITGDVIWARYCRGDIYNITKTDDGGFVFCLNEQYGFPPIYPYLVRLDASGNIIWQRKMYHQYSGSPVYRGILYDESGIYLAADYYNENPAISFLVERWDAVTGARIWEKRFQLPGQNMNFESLDKIADTLIVGLNFYTSSFPFQANFGIFKADISGNGMGGYKFSVNDVSLFPGQAYSYFNEHRVSRLTKTADNNFVFAEQSVISGDTVLQIKKFTGSGNVLWSRKYPNMKKDFVVSVKEMDKKLLIAGRYYGGIIDNTILNDGFLMKTDSSGQVTQNGSGDCYSEPSLTSMELLPPFSTAFLTPEPPQPSTEIQFHNYTPYRRPVNVWAELSCNTVSPCNNVLINGPSRICNISDTLTYVAIRNQGCQFPVSWLIDTARTKIVSTTDTSIRVYFTGFGTTNIHVKLNEGCPTLDTITVSVFSSADSLNLGPDITSCPDEQVILQANPGFKSYTWEDGSTTMNHIVNLPGIYYVDVEDSCGRINRDSITVGWYNPQFLTAGPDKIKCNADTLQLSATPGLTGYQWSPPYAILTPQSSTIAVNPLIDTTYYVTAIDNNGCNVYDTVKITVNASPPINLGPDIGFCAGDSALLDAGPSFISYSWNNGSSSQSIVIFANALYKVVATAMNGCSSADSIAVSVYSNPSNFLPAEVFLCNKDSIQLSPIGNFQAYLWNTGATSGLISIVQPGLFWLQVIDNNGCIAKEFVEVKEKKCVQGIYVPSAFTPDNNGRNDRFKPLVYERLKQYSFSIYNRWGSLVFTTRDISKGWDGKIAGVLQDANVYVWICSYQIEGKPMVEAKGTFVLIR